MAWRVHRPRRLMILVWALLIPVLAACNLLTTSDNSGPTTVQITGAPVVRIAAPLPNSTFLEGVTVNIQAQITNAGADINRVEVVVDNTIVATLTSPNTAGAAAFSITQSWPAVGNGQHVIAVTAFRADGSSSAPATVNINVVAQGAQVQPASATPVTNTQPTTGTGGVQPTADTGGQANLPQPTTPPQPTNPPEPTAVPPTSTPSNPIATFNQGANVRSGPSTLFNPPIGSFAAGATADVLGVTPAGDWYKIRYYNSDGWVFAQLITVSGDTSRIPVDAGPPIPTLTPVPPTPVPVTPTPVTSANLTFAGSPSVSPHPLRCNETATIKFTITNNGTTATNAGGSVSVRDILVSSGAVLVDAPAPGFGILQPGENTGEAVVPITVGVNYAEAHKIVITIDSGNAVAETNEGDNVYETTYVLDKAGCP
ncbi:MAG: SH3 domain-containing protein [Anaerolineaceae bacterium]|nr:SH3 domain-containing protein [Anaerolineaceae bacterium]